MYACDSPIKEVERDQWHRHEKAGERDEKHHDRVSRYQGC